MKNIDRMGVLILMSHLIITLAVIVVYAVTLITGKGNPETLATFLAVIIGYWFGSMGTNAIRKPEQQQTEEEKKGA